jgi:hypothetical protein
VPPATAPSRAFNTTTGVLFHQVIPARAADFERLIAYVRDALAKTTNETVRDQTRGLQFYRAVEAGPNGDILYVFLLSPAVPCVDYALGPLLSEAYPDPAQLSEIWKLYTSSVRPMGTFLLNLAPVPVKPATAPLTPPTTPSTSPDAPAPPSPTAKPSVPPAKE